MIHRSQNFGKLNLTTNRQLSESNSFNDNNAKNVWSQTRTPISVNDVPKENDVTIKIPGYYHNNVLLDEIHKNENKQREEKYPKIEISTKILNEMVEQLKNYQDFLKNKKDDIIIEENKISEKDDEILKQKLEEKQAAEIKEQKIKSLQEQVDMLSDQLEKLSGEYPTTEVLQQIQEKREKMEEFIMDIKDIQFVNQKEEKRPVDFDKYIALEEHTLNDIDQMITDLQEEIKLIEKQDKQERNISYYQQLQNFLKDLLLTKVDRLQKINDEKKQQKINIELEQAQQKVKDLEIENLKLNQYQSVTEDENISKDKTKEILEDFAQEKGQSLTEAQKQLENELDQALADQENISYEAKVMNAQVEQDKEIDNNEKELEKLDETLIDLTQQSQHDEIEEDALQQRDDILSDIQKVKDSNTGFSVNYKGASLKHKLDLDLTPMYSNLKSILDKNYANTDDFSDYIVEEDVMTSSDSGLTKLRSIQSSINSLQSKIDLLFKDVPISIDKLPKNSNSQVGESLIQLDKLVLFINEFEIEKGVIDKLILSLKALLNGMNMNIEELLDFFQVVEEYNKVKIQTEFTIDDQIIKLKEEINNCSSTFNSSVEKLKSLLEKFENKMSTVSNDVQRISNAIPEEARNKKNNYSRKRLNLLDFVLEELIALIKQKINIDENIQDMSVMISKMATLRKDILDNIQQIEHQLQLEENKDTNSKNILAKSKNSVIYYLSCVLLMIF